MVVFAFSCKINFAFNTEETVLSLKLSKSLFSMYTERPDEVCSFYGVVFVVVVLLLFESLPSIFNIIIFFVRTSLLILINIGKKVEIGYLMFFI